jgi:hypothetical protein
MSVFDSTAQADQQQHRPLQNVHLESRDGNGVVENDLDDNLEYEENLLIKIEQQGEAACPLYRLVCHCHCLMFLII